MADTAVELPDDIETLKAMLLATRAETAQLRAANAEAEVRIERLHALIETLERARYGRRSEALDPDQHEFAFEEIQTGLGAIEATLDTTAKTAQARAPRLRKKLPAHLERVEVVIEPEAATCRTCGSAERVKIGEDVSERLDVLPARLRVIVARRPRYACAACRDEMVQAPAPPHLIEAGIPTEGLLARIAVAKYADGLPLYRQEAIYGREHIELPRNLMAGWMGRIGFHLEPLADRVAYAACLQTSSSQRDKPLPLSGGSAACPVASNGENAVHSTQDSGLDWVKIGEQVNPSAGRGGAEPP
jgi:transposase